MMKIIHMISGGDVGGAKTHVLSLLAGLNRSETVHLVCFTEGEFAAEARQLGIPTTVMEDGNLFRVRKRILAMIRHDGYQVIHCHGARANLMGLMLKKKAGVPVISTVHSDYRLDYMGRPLAALTFGNINKFVLPRFDAWVGVSDGMTRLLISRGFDPWKIYTLYNGVDFSQERSPASREDYDRKIGLWREKDSVVFGIAARISPVKDMTTLVQAFGETVKKHPSARLLIAGDGEQETEIRDLVARLCPDGSVCFVGWERDIDSFYHALDVNVLTSLSETFPYALTEGARMGCATIASRVGGVPDLIIHEENGLLFEPRDVQRLSAHMNCMIERPEQRQHMAEALHRRVREEFSLKHMVDEQKHIYETILRRRERDGKRDGVLICGAYGKGNRGDNAILLEIVKQLRDIDPDVPICALSRSPRETCLDARISSIYTFRVGKIRKWLKRAELYISGGGTLMQDATSTRSLLYYLFSIRQAKRQGCKVMLYGCGVGPISKERNRKRTTKTLNACADVISVRDTYSRDFLDEIGVRKREVHLTADPALLLEATGERASGLSKKKKYALFSLRPWAGYCEETFAEVIETVSAKHGLHPILYCMEPNRDLPLARSLAARLSCPCDVMEAGERGEDVIRLLRSVQLVVSMRLHTLIFAAGLGIPMVGVVYDPKVSGFLDNLGQTCYISLEQADVTTLCRLVEEALMGQVDASENLTRLRRLAEKNKHLAAALLEKS